MSIITIISHLNHSFPPPPLKVVIVDVNIFMIHHTCMDYLDRIGSVEEGFELGYSTSKTTMVIDNLKSV
jgi:hypothetical protein